MSFEAHCQRQIHLSDILQTFHSHATRGSLIVEPDPLTVHSMAIAAQLSIFSVGLAPPIRLEEELLTMKSGGSQALRSVAANASDGILLAVENLSVNRETIDVLCLPEKVTAMHRSFDLGPGEMRVVPACSGIAAEFSFANSQDLRDLGAVGINIVFSGKPGEMAAFGAYVLSSASSKPTNKVAALAFADPADKKSTQIYAAVPVGYTDLLPGGDNLMRNSFLIQSSGPPAAVASNLVAMNDSGALVEMLGKDPQHIENGGGHPWSIAGHTNSTLFLFNSSMGAVSCDVNISRGSSTWHNSYKLQPDETRLLNINKVITQRLPDKAGQLLLGCCG